MAAGYTNTFRLPPSLNVIEGNVSENYKKWKRQVEVYLMASVPLFIPYEMIINVNNLGTRTIQNYCYLHFFVFLYGAARHQINFNLGGRKETG
jgi:hypothetical protein